MSTKDEIRYNREFMEKILSSISSGIIAIDTDRKISIFNQKASAILKMRANDIIGGDLSALPSPLGDILYETMSAGTVYKRYEMTISNLNISLGINSYRLHDEQNEPVGAGIIFCDLSESKALEEQRRMTDNLRAVNNIASKIAHEIRNPLTSIQTYAQLLNEKFRDDELKNFYISAVSQSINMLDNLVDKLATFSGAQDFRVKRENINDVMCQAAEYISGNIPRTHRFFKQPVEKSFYINVDRKRFMKALYYLVLNIVDRTPDGTYITMNARTTARERPSALITITYRANKVADKDKHSMSKPILDIDNFGTELNIPISRKIIEGHKGSLDMTSDGNVNTFIIKLPVFNERSGISHTREGNSGE